mgnify:FL=1|jgi:hypothetical protein
MKVIKDNGTYRVVYTEQLIKDDNGYGLIKRYKVQIYDDRLFLKDWLNIKVFEAYDGDKDEVDYIKNEAIDLYNKIVYPDKYFITNAVCE